MEKLNFTPLKGLLCFLIGHLFHARPITFRNERGPHTITSLCPVIFSLPFGFQYLIGLSQVSSSFLRVDEASNTAERMQGGVFHSCTPVRCSNVVSRPKGRLTRSEELQKVHLTTSDASIPEPVHLGGGKIRGSSEVCQQGRKEVSRLAGKAKRRRRAKPREGSLARPRLPTPPPGSTLRGELRRCPLDGRREGHSRPKCLRPRSRRCRRRCC